MHLPTNDCLSLEEIVFYIDMPLNLDEDHYIGIGEHLKICEPCQYAVAWWIYVIRLENGELTT